MPEHVRNQRWLSAEMRLHYIDQQNKLHEQGLMRGAERLVKIFRWVDGRGPAGGESAVRCADCQNIEGCERTVCRN